MTKDQRGLDGDEETGSVDADLQSEEQSDVIGRTDDLDPLRCRARSRAKRTPPVIDGQACFACLEPLLPRGPTLTQMVGGTPVAVHVDCDDPSAQAIDCRQRLY